MYGLQSSFELTGYITDLLTTDRLVRDEFQSSFELTDYITNQVEVTELKDTRFQSSFELTGYITVRGVKFPANFYCFKALSSLRVI